MATSDRERPGYSVRIRGMAATSRPQEWLQREGPASLSDAELLAIILRVGSARGSTLSTDSTKPGDQPDRTSPALAACG